MNLNKSTIGITNYTIILLVIVIWVLFLVFGLPLFDGTNLSNDAIYGYAQDIDSEIVTDWHSSLFGYEGIALKRMARFFDIHLCGKACITVMASIIVTLMMLAVSYLTYVGCKKSLWCVLLPICVFVVTRINEAQFEWRLDHFFVYLLFCLVAGIVALYRIRRKWWKTGVTLCVLLVLWHCCAFRKNSIIMAPVVMGAVCYSYEKFRQFSYKKVVGFILLLTCSFAAVVGPLMNFIMPAVKTYPITPMLVSDVRIAHILNGTQDSFLDNSCVVGRSLMRDNLIGAHWHFMHGNEETCLLCNITKKKNVYHCSNPWPLFLEGWKTIPKEMLVAKLIQVVQFYRIDKVVLPLEFIIEKAYPCIASDSRINWPNTFSRREIVLIWGTFSLLLITSQISFKRYKKNGKNAVSFDAFYLFAASLAFML